MKFDEVNTFDTASENIAGISSAKNNVNEKLAPVVRVLIHDNLTAAFDEMIAIIDHSRLNAFRAVNHIFIDMYWEIGKYISNKVNRIGWVN